MMIVVKGKTNNNNNRCKRINLYIIRFNSFIKYFVRELELKTVRLVLRPCQNSHPRAYKEEQKVPQYRSIV